MSFSGKRFLWKCKDFSTTLPQTNVSKGVTEINGKQHELSFTPHYTHEEFISLQNYCFCKSNKKISYFGNLLKSHFDMGVLL